MTHVASRTRPSLFLRVTLKGGCGLGTRLPLGLGMVMKVNFFEFSCNSIVITITIICYSHREEYRLQL